MRRIAFVCVLFLLAGVAAGCGAAETPSPPTTSHTVEAPAASIHEASQPTLEAGAFSPVGSLALTMPGGQVLTVPVVQCLGTESGQSLDVRAENSQDLADPQRVEVQVTGAGNGAGERDNVYVSVIVGPDPAWAFMGNNPAARVTFDQDGSGRFSGVPIVNVSASSSEYQLNTEYLLSAEWSCNAQQ